MFKWLLKSFNSGNEREMTDKEEERIFSLFNEVLLFNIRYGESCLTSTCSTGVQSVHTRMHLERTFGRTDTLIGRVVAAAEGAPIFFWQKSNSFRN